MGVQSVLENFDSFDMLKLMNFTSISGFKFTKNEEKPELII